jgi:hypothetical protein
MPCVALPRGKADVKLPFRVGTQHDPCGCKIVNTVNGVSYAASNLCIFHLGMRLGQAAMVAPIVQAP